MVQAAANVTIKGITFDGENNTDTLIILYARCPGTRLEDLKLRGAAKDALLIANCVGTAEQPVTLRNLEFDTEPGKTAIRFKIFSNTKTLTVNRFFTISNCTFNGLGDRIITANDDYVDRKTIDLSDKVPLLVK
jgi:hypothetical protein